MKKNLTLKFGLSLLALLLLAGCGGSGIETQSGDQNTGIGSGSQSTAASFQNASVQLNLFSLGSDAPTDISIPDIEGFRETAFILTDLPAPGVVPYDLVEKGVSKKFPLINLQKLNLAKLVGNTRQIKILSRERALLLGIQGLVYFNPSSGEVLDSFNLRETVDLGQQSLKLSAPIDDDPESWSGDFSPNYAAGMAVLGARVFVSMDNLYFDGPPESPSYFAQGFVRVFDLQENPGKIQVASPGFILMDGFNPSGMTTYQDQLFVTLTGATEIEDGGQTPITESKIVKVDPKNSQVSASLNLGLVAANYNPMAIDSNGHAFIGSAAYGEVYEIDLKNFKVLRGADNPIAIPQDAQDFLTDQAVPWGGKLLYVSSFNQSALFAIDLESPERRVLEKNLSFHLDPNPGTTGIGSFELRLGQPGIDFTGPDFWALTTFPGTLSSATTY